MDSVSYTHLCTSQNEKKNIWYSITRIDYREERWWRASGRAPTPLCKHYFVFFYKEKNGLFQSPQANRLQMVTPTHLWMSHTPPTLQLISVAVSGHGSHSFINIF